jgi:hypothetical protein
MTECWLVVNTVLGVFLAPRSTKSRRGYSWISGF